MKSIKSFFILSIMIATGCSTNTAPHKSEVEIKEPESHTYFKAATGLPANTSLTAMAAEADTWKKTLPDDKADYGPYPTEYKLIINSYLRSILKDPDSAKISKISKPRKEHKIVNQFKKEAIYGYSSCVFLNAKNSYGGYVGEKPYWFFIRNGRVIDSSDNMGQIYIGRSKNCTDG